MKTFIQVLEGARYEDAQVVALIDAPSVVDAVRHALTLFFRVPPARAVPAASNGQKHTTYMRKYGKTLKVLAAEAGLHPSVVASRTRRGWTMKEALKTPARPRRSNGTPAKRARAKKTLDKPPQVA